MAKKVTLIHRRDCLRASKFMQERAKANPKISILWNTVVEEILGENKVAGLRLKNIATNAVSEFSCDGVFLALGHEPSTALFKGLLELDEKGYITVKEGTTSTSVPGVFAAGDCVDSRYRQAITAAGTGCMAALDAERWLLNKD